MRRLLLPLLALLVSFTTTASASQGLNLRWTNCLGDGGAMNRNFACTTNAGINLLIGSFELGSAMTQVSGLEFLVDVQTASASLPAWWSFKNPTTCRQTSMAINFVIPATAANCVDWANGQSTGGIGAYNIGFLSPSRARIVAVVAVPQSALADLDPAQEYYSFSLLINNAKTVGAGACPGCATSANLYFVQQKVTTPVPANDRTISGPTNCCDSNVATWQGGFPTATRRETWGAVKALYR